MNKPLTILCVICLAAGCSSGGGGTDTGASNEGQPKAQNETVTMATQYFPLTDAYAWQYTVEINEAIGDYTREHTYSTVDGIVTFNNSLAYKVKGDILEPYLENEISLFSKWDDGIYMLGLRGGYTANVGFYETITFTPAIRVLASSFTVGDSWTTTTQAQHQQNGILIDEDQLTFTVSVEAIEDVTTSAGIFTNCYRLHLHTVSSSQPSETEDSYIWLAEGVGIVKETLQNSEVSSSRELRYASLNGNEYGQAVVGVHSSILDDFDDGVLDLSWSINYERVASWTYSESGTELNMSDITLSPGENLGTVVLQQAIEPHGDFNVTYSFSWDSEQSLAATQGIYLQLQDNDDNALVWTGYQDDWPIFSGTIIAQIGSNNYSSSSLPDTGNATITVSRVGQNISIFWDGNLILSGVDSRPVEVLEISFPHSIANGSTSFFGNQAVDLISMY